MPIRTRAARTAVPDVVDPATLMQDDLWPGKHLPAHDPGLAVTYDSALFLDRIARAEAEDRLDPHGSDRYMEWTDRGWARESLTDYAKADAALDPAAIQWGHFLLGPGRPRTNWTTCEDPCPVDVTLDRARTIDRFTGQMLVAFEDGFPDLPHLLHPDETIANAVERGFEFAARAIAVGVDDTIARSWATGIAVHNRYAKVPLRWVGDAPLSEADGAVWPRRTLVTEYYEAAIEDLRERQDATRFMDLIGRCYRWPTR